MDTQRKAFFASPQEAEAAFYDARNRGDIEGMMAVWADEDDIVCILEGCQRASGYEAVREAWRRMFAGAQTTVRTGNAVVMQGALQAIHSVHETLTASGERSPRAALAVTNVYVRGPLGWHLVLHHASALPAAQDSAELPKILH
ncbi:YybH family protein [Methyloversatilis thermotolerans]|uniref:YybH family protein n=1 Tax=Methyloversatilis thermotolerans TaxID=1346290 RepID=UPI00035D7EDC|nr:nuclear transport factor 2 family protein [Methyloversatilis thermotolerans]